MEELEKDFTAEDIPKMLKTGESSIWSEIAKKFPQGKDMLLYLAKKYPGERIYVPRYDNLMKPVRKRHYQSPKTFP